MVRDGVARPRKVTEVLPVLYLRGISSKDFVPALAEFFGSEAGLSALVRAGATFVDGVKVERESPADPRIFSAPLECPDA